MSQLLVHEDVRGQRPKDCDSPQLHPLLREHAVGEPLARPNDKFGSRQTLARDVGINRLLTSLKRLKATHVHRFARAELADDHSHFSVARSSGECAVRGVAVEVDELAQNLIKIRSGTVGVAERAYHIRQLREIRLRHCYPYPLWFSARPNKAWGFQVLHS